MCPNCGQNSETIGHALWWCAKSTEVWVSTPFWESISKFKGLGCEVVLRGLSECLKADAVESICMVLWGIWQSRNVVVHEAVQAVAVAAKAPSSWSPPLVGSLKLNTNTSVKKGSQRCGVGAVIRDEKGWIVAALSKNWLGNFSPEAGELIALREGLLLAQKLQLRISCVEVDAYNVASMVSGVSFEVGESEFVVADVRALFKEVGVQKCQSISRNGNRVAHNLASLALSSLEDLVWQNV
ncbi:hypothetical protein LWI29_013838 [Acer saccharum]|uniref:RNase H type-1 domain-containing protein n=1 Tax=Acer saccharum TaxID=4024 RepID=A0AA39VN73_ACESA|nr:hypothetical protein LWI29_013838 [Acer saccharum]